MPIITLTTDFGMREGYHAVMKGVIYGIIPDVKIVDISHDIHPQDIHEAAFILEINVFYFPAKTVHVVVVDPGVGTERRPIAVQIGSQLFVAPDNGVLTRVLMCAERENWPVQCVYIDKPEYWLEDISTTFHGRDIFAPTGAHLAAGVPLEAIGTPIKDLIRLEMHPPKRTKVSLVGEVIHIDHFGNAITNIRAHDIAHLGDVSISLCGQRITGLSRTFGDAAHGTLLAVWDSSEYLMVSEYGGLKGISPERGDQVLVENL
ncbi:MAG: SAM-dependent chlorinase/fluorinase [Anaerolineaceae bacterium]|nr:SAM-dependent chlorinase/fluorinase [Anaerolineaceae bacterium]